MVKQRTGLCFEVIPPSEEARLALASCENLLDPEIPYGLLIDIGGGSTEVSWIRVSHRADRLGGVATELLDMTSVPWGVVTLTESCVKGQPREQPVTRACYDDMVERIRADLRPFCAKHEIGKAIARGEVQMVGASGTVTTVSAHHLGLKRYNRTLVDGSRIGRDSILRICDQLVGEIRRRAYRHALHRQRPRRSRAGRRRHPRGGVPPVARADGARGRSRPARGRANGPHAPGRPRGRSVPLP